MDHLESLLNVEKGVVTADRRSVLHKSTLGVAAILSAALGLGSRKAPAATATTASSEMIRLVVTSNNSMGKSYISKDEVIKRDQMWNTSAGEPLGPILPQDPKALLPTVGPAGDLPAGGTRAYFFTIQPAKTKFDRAALKGWERSASIVYIFFLSGEITYVTDEGEITMKAGNVLVQRNAMHAWHNPTDTALTAFAVKVRV